MRRAIVGGWAMASLFMIAGSSLAQTAMPSPADPVVGVAQYLDVIPNLRDGIAGVEGFTWTQTIQIEDASFLKAHLVDVNLAPGDRLTLRSARGNVVEEIRARGPKDQGTFWSLSALGEALILQFTFTHAYAYVPFRIDQVIVGNAGLFDEPGVYGESICAPEDFDDVICYQSDAPKWSNVLASVGVMSVGGNPANAIFCSGSNVSPRNFVLTNYHCLASQANCDNSEFVFKYYRTACNTGAPPTTDWKSFRCDQIVAQSPLSDCDPTLNGLDFSLCSVIGDPTAEFGSVQPDRALLTDGEALYIIGHPAGRPHEITHGDGADVDVDGHVLRYYGTLDTEGGSSGSPIFRESDHRLVGLHHCGGCESPGVGNRGMLMSDIYPLIEDYVCTSFVNLTADGFSGLAGGPEIHGFAMQELTGNRDAVMDPGETWQFDPRVINTACDLAATGVRGTVRVGASSAPVIIHNPEARFGDIAAGQSATSVRPLVFTVGSMAACGSSVVFDLTDLTSNEGGPFDDSKGFFVALVGAEKTTSLFYEDFASGLGAWTIVDSGGGTGPAATWTTDNPGGRTLPLTSPFAIVDSNFHGSFNMSEQLISPVIDVTGISEVFLQFRHDFNWFEGGLDEKGAVAVRSSATNGIWERVALFEDRDESGVVSIDISAQAANQPDVQVRFYYFGANAEMWWAIDDVFVLVKDGFTCEPPSFTQFGLICPDAGGHAPRLSGSGDPVADGSIRFGVRDGAPNSSGFLVLALTPDLSGSCLKIIPPFVATVPLPLDGTGKATLTSTLPHDVPSNLHVFAQWLQTQSGEAKAYTNGLDIYIR